MMWSSIANLKQNLEKIALDVHEDDEDLEIHASTNGYDSSVSDRRNSHRFAHSKSVSPSPIANGNDSPYTFEIEQYKAQIKRLQESEAEIKALSLNYAAILKEKEDQISRLNQENGSLKQNLDSTKEALNVSRNEHRRASTSSIKVESGDQSPKRPHRSATQAKSRGGNQIQNGVFPKHDGMGNGILHDVYPDVIQSEMETKKDKELADLLEEKNRSLKAVKDTHELEIKELRTELEKERCKSANIQIKLQEEQSINKSFQEELRILNMDHHKTSVDVSKIHNELNEKTSEIRQLQIELSRREDEDPNVNVKSLKRVIATLEKENANLKMERNELEAALKRSKNSSPNETSPDGKVDSTTTFPRKEEMELLLQKLERDLKETCHEKEKALQQLARLKQHLLEKESEESEKMDEDSKIIEELRQSNECQKAQILHLEKALKQAIAGQEEVRMMNSNEIQKSKEMTEDLKKKLANCMSTIESKNVELLNLQTALGQYFAEVEAKDYLERQLALTKEESAKRFQLLKEAEIGTEESKREKEEILAKLSDVERKFAEGKSRVNKLEEDNAKLRRAVEQSMSRLNRMSMDSDYLVDRRIVIKLLVTYFQRNHSKEVLDLMVRMLGFSDEDKQRIGVAQQGGKGVVRGVLGLPGRLVGGILGGSAAGVQMNLASDNQSFADMWVDFLLKETEEREKRESGQDTGRPNEDSQGRSPNATGVSSSVPNHGTSTSGPNLSTAQNHGPVAPRGNSLPFAHIESEFSTVPLTSLDSSSRISRLLTKH
ncbi:golgin candidate 4-like isoform X1 [Populus alba x Populus x berolinensis]|uniref:Golgin candidate 4-like isoform X1 n=1 Tax=Populus alba x Populus x berolinensis TaxID=444605 RepID=A0AAD6LSI5_9ROSI|nr:golgin candidate 4-like isoform X1 [Populus alba x Populus x berolinensis]